MERLETTHTTLRGRAFVCIAAVQMPAELKIWVKTHL